MGGNYTLSELEAELDTLHFLYPNIVSKKMSIGQSIEGRDIWAIKVSDNVDINENVTVELEPLVLYTGLTHAREPLSMMNLIYFIRHLCENYNINKLETDLVNNREMWFVPCVNPDGYVYNERIAPNGGGMHRKNRKDTGCGEGTTRGVDINRNFGFNWGTNDLGSSPEPCSPIYRGESAFSEPETSVLKDFMLKKKFRNVLHYHTYSNVYIHAFGDGSLPDEPDLTTLTEIGHEMARYNGYTVGTGLATIGYTVNGDAVDWTYGGEDIISYVPEVGSPSQGFWPSEDEITQLCSDQLHSNKTFAFVAGSDMVMYSFELSEEFILPGEEIDLEIVIQNRGLSDSDGDTEMSFSSLNNLISLDTESYTMSEMDARDSDDFSLSFTVDDAALPGSYSGVFVTLDSDNNFSRQDTIKFLIGQPETVFYDGFENELIHWAVDGDWGLTNDAATGSFAMSDSPDDDYQAGQETIAELTTGINLGYFLVPMVTFSAKWDIESNWDFVRFQAHIIDSGWVSLEGLYTEPGTGQPAQPFGEHGYDGTQDDWVDEIIYLDQLDGVEVSGFRFVQTSDNFVEADGFTVDDFSITGFPLGAMGDFNSDMSIDIFDLLSLADLLLFGDEPSDTQLFFCDLDGNEILDIMDLINLSDLILGI